MYLPNLFHTSNIPVILHRERQYNYQTNMCMVYLQTINYIISYYVTKFSIVTPNTLQTKRRLKQI